MSRRNSLADPKKIIISEPMFSNKTLIKIRQLNELASRRPKLLPSIYAKAEQLNRRLSVSNVDQDHTNFSSASSISYANMNEKEREYFVKEYRHRKKSIIVSKYLDDELKHRFEQLKYSTNPSRRASVFEVPSSNDLHDYDTDSDIKKLNDGSTLSLQKTKSPRFGSTLSRDGQYAIMKSLEDTIINEIESMYPECKGKISRTSTAQFRKSLSQSSSFLAPPSFKDLAVESKLSDNLYYSKSELFSESDCRETLPDIEMQKKIKVSHHIENAMEILDKLRFQNKKLEKTMQPKKVNYLDNVLVSSTSKKKLVPIKKSISDLNLDNLDKNNIEPITQFSQWKNNWTKELENF